MGDLPVAVIGGTAIYAGTFDPPTNGHLDLIRRAAAMFARVVVCVSSEGRRTHFGIDERLALLRPLVAGQANVVVEPFDGLVVEAARRHSARAMVRGLRVAKDWEYELPMAYANASLAPEIETVFLASTPGTSMISGSLVREVAALGGDVSAWVPPSVAAALKRRPPARKEA